MDDYFFEAQVRDCTIVQERTSYLEIFNFEDGSVYYNKAALPTSEFDNFFQQKGMFDRKEYSPLQIVSGLRLVLQLHASNDNTFRTGHISVPHDVYIRMVRDMKLSFRAIEGTGAVGPFFWSALDLDRGEEGSPDDNPSYGLGHPHLQIVSRKSDVQKRGKTRGWELMLSHDFRSGITSGFAKGTESSKLHVIIDTHLHACRHLVAHPLLLPALIFGADLDSAMDELQRESRQKLRLLENMITDRREIGPEEELSTFDPNELNRELVECYGKVLWKRPQAYLDALAEVGKAMRLFQSTRKTLNSDRRSWLPDTLTRPAAILHVNKIHRSLENRVSFIEQKLKGIQHYSQTSISRLEIQINALYNTIAQKDSKLNLEMAHRQRVLALGSKRDNQSMKALSVVGAVFLPATYLASLFSMTFFNFQGGNNQGGGSSSDGQGSATVSSLLWIYFAFTIPITLLVLIVMYWWDKQREKKYAEEEERIGLEMVDMDKIVMEHIQERKKTGFVSVSTKRIDTV